MGHKHKAGMKVKSDLEVSSVAQAPEAMRSDGQV
jgi:hypothetical protein